MQAAVAVYNMPILFNAIYCFVMLHNHLPWQSIDLFMGRVIYTVTNSLVPDKCIMTMFRLGWLTYTALPQVESWIIRIIFTW